MRDNMGRPVDNGQLGVVDPEGRAVALHLYDGVIKVEGGGRGGGGRGAKGDICGILTGWGGGGGQGEGKRERMCWPLKRQ